MKRRVLVVSLLAFVLLLSVSAAALGAPAYQYDPEPLEDLPYSVGGRDDLMHPLGKERRARRQVALQQRLQGIGAGAVQQVAPGEYVQLELEEEDLIFTILGEFGNNIHPRTGGARGPRHNQIEEPDGSVNNWLLWVPDFNTAYYEDLLFNGTPGANSMRNYYLEQSSGVYTVDGDVTDWVRVPYNASRYGSNRCGGGDCGADVWLFLRHSADAWFKSRRDAGDSPAEINAYLSQFDIWDRYDYDGDGNFDEPDGYIDHFQAVHAGLGEDAGGGAQGGDAIWSHRWYAYLNTVGSDGPDYNPAGGTRIGNSNYWIGDYTVEGENGGLGVFAHEFAHDLDLPDLYDYGGNNDNSVGFWSLMAVGSWLDDGQDSIGNKPGHMGNWEKFQLGWLDFDVAVAGERSTHQLNPAEYAGDHAQGLFVLLPDKEVILDLGDAYAGEQFYYSGQGDNLDNVMYREFDLPANATLTAQVRYQIELDWDYAYVIASDDGGATWTNVETNLSTDTDPNGQNEGNGITGSSGGDWMALTADLSAYTGPTLLGFRYWTDVAVVEPGFQVDEITVSGAPADGAESDTGWTYDPEGGFHVTTGTESSFHFNAYVAEWRTYWGYDEVLRDGPYHFGYWEPPLWDWVDHFPYQDGLLISYWDDSQSDNNTSLHPGQGLILPIDAHPKAIYFPDGQAAWGRFQSYDSTFGRERTDGFQMHYAGEPWRVRSSPAVAVFNDNRQYWNPETPGAGVMNPHTGTQIGVRTVDKNNGVMTVEVR